MTREEWKGLTSFTVILLIFSASFVIGMGAAVASTSDPEQNVCRDLPSGTQAPGSVTTVSLATTVGSATYYAIDEEVPSGWTVTGASDGGDYTAESGHVKWVVTSGAVDKTYTYTVQIPGDASGTSAFSGEFQMGASSSDTIDCDITITVEGTSGDSSDSNDLGTTTINDQETDDQETNDPETNDPETNDPETNDPETDDESSSESTASASTTLKSAATTQSAADNSAEEVPASEAGSSMFAIVIGAIVIVSYKLKEN